MNALPEAVRAAWADRSGPAVFATVDPTGTPNAVYVGSMRECGDNLLVIADNYFSKTRANIHSGSRGSLVFLTNARRSYQLKGTLEYHASGPLYDFMKQWNPAKHPGVAAAVLRIEEVYSGAERIV